MRWLTRLTVVLAMMLPSLVALPDASAVTGTPLTFGLVSPDTAVSPDGGTMASPGDRIEVTGAGTFNLVAETVAASGTFVHYQADGTVHCKGTWTATALSGWIDFGANSAGRHGGVISLLVTVSCMTMHMTHTSVPMTMTSILNAPSDSYVEGTTLDGFTVPTGGRVIIAGR